MTPPMCSGALLTRKQQWRRMGNLSRRKMNILTLPQDSTLLKNTVHEQQQQQQQQQQQIMRHGVAKMPSAAAPISSLMHQQQQSNADPSVNRSRGVARRPYSKIKSGRGKNLTPGEIAQSKYDLDFINDADLDERGHRYTNAPLPSSSETPEGKTVDGHEAGRMKRVVSFDSCIRVILVPTRRELDATTLHDVWWGREDARQFRRTAVQYRREHGTLSGVTEKELEETGTPPGMPPFLSG
ncbi:unnamed protein product [Ascophyllum nodosum]